MTHGHQSSGQDIIIHKVQPRERGRLEIVSPAIADDQRIGELYSAYHDNLSPPLSWTLELDAESFALVVEDPDAPRERPFVHWLIWNIPGTATGLSAGVPEDVERWCFGSWSSNNDSSDKLSKCGAGNDSKA